MSDSLRDQLLALGFRKPAESRPEAPKPASRHPGKPGRDESSRQLQDRGQQQRRQPESRKPHAGQGKPGNPRAQNRPATGAQNAATPASRAEIDLAKAYAIRAQSERAEKQRAEHAQAELARQKRERKAKLAELLQDKSRNAPDADIARNFSHGEKIRRIYVTAAQLKALNVGELGVVQYLGRYMLVDRDTALAAQAIWPEALALLPDPDAPAEDDVPADLVW